MNVVDFDGLKTFHGKLKENSIQSVITTDNGIKFLDGNGNVIHEVLLVGNAVRDSPFVAGDNEVNEMFNEIMGGN